MNRRKFLGIAGKTIISAAVAPAIVRAESIMRIKPIVTLDDIFDISPLDTPFGRNFLDAVWPADGDITFSRTTSATIQDYDGRIVVVSPFSMRAEAWRR